MRHFRFALFLAALLIVVTLPAFAADRLSAEPVATGPFGKVSVSGHADLVLVQDGRETVVVEASPKTRAKVRVRNSDGHLRIDVEEDERSWFGSSRGRPTITVHFKTLDELELKGVLKTTAAAIEVPSLHVDARGATSMNVASLKVGALRFTGSGAVKGEFAGSATDQNVRISGAGEFKAPKLVSETATVTVSGAGKVEVNARRSLDASISGAGAIDYYGDPQLTERISGAGKIRQRAGKEVRAALAVSDSARYQSIGA